MTTEARDIQANEYDAQSYIDPAEVDMLMGPVSRDEAERAVKPLAQRKTDRITLYHPDPMNTSSVYIVPMNATERRFVIGRLLQKTKEVMGKTIRWNYPTRQVEASGQPLRCFVQGCMRAGGFQTRASLIAHVQGKHSNEMPMYAKLIEALMEQIYRDIPAETYAQYGLEAPDEAAAPLPKAKGRAG